MSDREQEKILLDRIIAVRESETAQLFAKLFKVRLEMHKTALVSSESDVVRGKAQECRHLLKELKFSGD